jgi:DNA-binding SARP family transcriptional activator
VQFSILGPLEVQRDGFAVQLGGDRQRALLAFLLLHAGEIVSTERLADELWRDESRAAAARLVETHVDSLRRAIGREALVARFPGYLLSIDSEDIDLRRFERLVEEGRAALATGQPEDASVRLREALRLWRGPALADFRHERFAQAAGARLEELRLAALEERVESDLALEKHAEILDELQSLVAAHPLRERLRGQLMLALHRAGRSDEALATYEEGRRTFDSTLGIEPAPSLERLERAIRAGDEALAADRARLPGGTVTLLLSDIEGSTRLLDALGDSYAGVLSTHRELIRQAVAEQNGVEVDAVGDGVLAAFASARAGLLAAVSAQRALTGHAWPGSMVVRVRMGAHTGQPARTQDGYVGLDVHRCARICSAAHGGQVLVSEATRLAVGDEGLGDLGLHDLGEHELKDLPARERLYQLTGDGLLSDFPPPRTPSAADNLQAAAQAAGQQPSRSILVAPRNPEAMSELVGLVEPLARSTSPHELILAQLVPAERAETLPETAASLNEIRGGLEERGLIARAAAFTSTEDAADVVRLSTEQKVDLLVSDCPPSLLNDGEIDDWLGTVLEGAPCDVALARPGQADPDATAVMLPFGGADHDWAALELAAWLATARKAPLRLLGTAGVPEAGKRDASRLLAGAALVVQRLLGVATEPLLVQPGPDGVIGAAELAEILVVGLSSRWREEGLGATRLTVLKTALPTTVLVRRGVRPGGLAPAEAQTRFTWSLAGAAGG